MGSTVGTSGGVFRPASAQGTTLVLIAAPDYVTVYGQRAELESIFGTDYQVVSLRTTSSAFIDAQLIYQPADAADIVDDERRQQQQQPPLQRNRLRSELLWRLYQQRIRSRGYVITVQTHWVFTSISFDPIKTKFQSQETGAGTSHQSADKLIWLWITAWVSHYFLGTWNGSKFNVEPISQMNSNELRSMKIKYLIFHSIVDAEITWYKTDKFKYNPYQQPISSFIYVCVCVCVCKEGQSDAGDTSPVAAAPQERLEIFFGKTAVPEPLAAFIIVGVISAVCRAEFARP